MSSFVVSRPPGPFTYNEATAEDVDVFTARTDSLGQPTRALWVLDAEGTYTWQGHLESGGPRDSSDVIPFEIPLGYLVTEYSLIISNQLISSGTTFFLSELSSTYSVQKNLSTFTSSDTIPAGQYTLLLGNGTVVLDYQFSLNLVSIANKAPTLSGLGTSSSFMENGSAVDLFSEVSLSTTEAEQGVASVTLTVSNVQNGAAEGLFIDGTWVPMVASPVGTTATNGMVYAVSVNNGMTTITLSKAGGVNTVAMKTLIDQISYRNDSEAPGEGERVVTITRLVDTGGTDQGGVDTALTNLVSTVTVTAVNDAPVISGISAADAQSVAATDGPVLVDQGTPATVTDVDSAHFDDGGLSVAIVEGAQTGDVLGIRTGSGVTLSDGLTFGSAVSVDGQVIGSIVFDGSEAYNGILSIGLNEQATPERVGTLQQNITFDTTGNTPGDRTVEFIVNDGEAASTPATTTITVMASPTVAITSEHSTLKAGDTTTVTLTFSQAPTNFEASDVTTTGGTLSNLQVTDDTKVYTAVFTPDAGTQAINASIAIAANAFEDEDGRGNLASNTLTLMGDTKLPAITSIVRQTPGTELTNADSLTYRVTFSEAVNHLDATDFVVQGPFATVTGLTFVGDNAYDVTVSGGNLASYNGTLVLVLVGSTDIADTVGNKVDPGAVIEHHENYVLDNVGPTPLALMAPAAAATYSAGQSLDFYVGYPETVFVDTSGGTPRFDLMLDSGPAYAEYVSGSGSDSLQFRYTAQPGHVDSDGITFLQISLNGGTIRDAAGNYANNGTLLSTKPHLQVDAATPVVTSVSVPEARVYKAGDALTFTVHFDEPVLLNATDNQLSLSLVIGSQVVDATGQIMPGNQAIAFTYLVQEGQEDTNGITVGGISLNGATIRDAAGNDASLSLNGLVDDASGVTIDAVAPVAPSLKLFDDLGTVTGEIQQNDYSDDTSLTLQGDVEPNVTVEIWDGQSLIDTVTADPQGVWSYVANTATDGATHAFSAVAVDAAGNRSPASVSTTVTIDTVAPVIDTITRNELKQPGGYDSFNVVVNYVDSGSGIDPGTIGDTDIVVRGWDGRTLEVGYFSIVPGSSTVTYTVMAPSGGWNGSYAGTYTVALNANEVRDKAGNAVVANANAHPFEISFNKLPLITSDEGKVSVTREHVEHTSTVTTITASDDDGDTLTFVLSGPDADLFELDEVSGELRFKDQPDARNPLDDGADGTYEIQVTVDDGNGGQAVQDLSITVLSDIDRDGTADIYDADMDGDGLDNTAEDDVPNTADLGTGDGNGDGIQDNVQTNVASFQTLGTSSPELSWATIAVDEGLAIDGVSSSQGAAGLPRNLTMPIGQIDYTVTSVQQGGAVSVDMFVDAGLKINGFFLFNEAAYQWVPIGSAVTESGSNKTKVSVEITDGSALDADGVVNGIVIVNGALGVLGPVINSDGGSVIGSTDVAENGTAVSVVTATQLPGASGITYAIAGGADADLFAIDAIAGALTFKVAPDFEAPADTGADNVYEVQVTATDDQGKTDTQTLSVTVTDVSEAPKAIIPVTAEITEGDTTVRLVDLLEHVTDPDANTTLKVREDSVTFLVDGDSTPEGGAALPAGVTLSGNSLTIDASSGFDDLAQGGTRTITAVYLVEDAEGLTAQQTSIITVNGVNDAPIVDEAIEVEFTEGEGEQTVSLLQHVRDVDAGHQLQVHDLAFTLNGQALDGYLQGVTLGVNNQLIVDPSHAAFDSIGEGQSHTLVISYSVSDEFDEMVQQTATIVIRGINDAPTVRDGILVELNEGEGARSVNLLEHAQDVDAGHQLQVKNLIFTLNDQSIEGFPEGVTLDDNNQLVVNPTHAAFDSLGLDQVLTLVASYAVSDEFNGLVPQTATILIRGRNDAPEVDDSIVVDVHEGSALETIDLLEHASDVDAGDSLGVIGLSFTVGGEPVAGLPDGFTLLADGKLSVDSEHAAYKKLGAEESLEIVAAYEVADGQGGLTPQVATITIRGVNDAPTVAGQIDEAFTEGSGVQTVNLLQGASDVDAADTLGVSGITYTVNGHASGPAGELPAGVTLTPDGQLVVDTNDKAFDFLAAGEQHTIVAMYQVEDQHYLGIEQTADITVTGVNDAPEIDLVSDAVQRVTVGRTATLPDFVVSDVDVKDQLTLTLTTLNGRLNGLDDADLGTDGIQLVGSAAEIDAALAAATFTATRAGNASIEFSLSDGYVENLITASYHLKASNLTEEPQPPKPPVIPPVDQWEGLPDNDGDGIPESVENLVPGMIGGVVGDGNGDGIADILQTDVSSLPWVQTPDGTTRFVTLTNGSGLAQLGVKPLEVSPGQVPSDLNLPLGLLAFQVDNVPDTGRVDFTVYIDSDIAVNGYWKQVDGEWVNIANSITTEGGKTKISFTIEDGGRFDVDGIKNGSIVDPGAPGWRNVVDPTEDADGDQFPDALESAHGLQPGVKDNDVFASTKLFVMQLYRDFLYREAEPEGLAYWQARLDSGELARADVAHAFLFASEFQDNAGAVARLYLGTYNRIPDNEGMHYWVDAVQDGQSLTQVAEQFAASDEFAELYGSLDDQGFVSELYLNVQSRQADAGGSAWWVSQLEGGMSRGEVLVRFTQSDEYVEQSRDAVSVTLNYVGLLDRTPEQAGFDYWVHEIEAGRSELEVIGKFIGTDEYHDRFLPADFQTTQIDVVGQTFSGGSESGALV